MSDAQIRERLSRLAASLFQRGYAVGSAGNISVRMEDGFLITPTNSCLGSLDPTRISKLDREGRRIAGDPPSKEFFLHGAFYETRPGTGAVVYLHSTYATAISCLTDIDREDAVPPLTPYVVMRVGTVRLVPYFRPGDLAMGQAIRDLHGRCSAVLLANHGSVVAAEGLEAAVYAAEELEETAKLVLLLSNRSHQLLTRGQVEDLKCAFGTSN
jgi:ribulose-5-phosphate 4-epimerase/fuculose-1-phosphate aldolase